MKTLAIFSPNENAYSETFIRAHKNLPFNIKYYYGGRLPSALEGHPDMLDISFTERVKRRFVKGFSFAEKKLLFSLHHEKVDFVLAEYGHTAAESLHVIQHLGLPLIVHFHGYDASEQSIVAAYGKRYKDVFNYASSVVAVSKKMKRDLLAMGCPEGKIVINYYGPNDDYLRIEPAYDNLQFVSVGRFVKKKAPHLTILAFQEVVKKYPEAKLVMIGEGELLSVCRELVRALQLDDNVFFKGILSTNDIAAVFKNSLAFVQHSIITETGDAEGTPVAVIEAQAAGLAVVATRHAGIPDVVIDNETGLLVNEQDVAGMTGDMLRIIKEEGLAKRLGEQGKKRIEEHFSMNRSLQGLHKIILAAADNR